MAKSQSLIQLSLASALGLSRGLLLCEVVSSLVYVNDMPSEEMASCVSVHLCHCKAQCDFRDCTHAGVKLWHVSHIPQYMVQLLSTLAPLVNLCLLFSCRGGGI